MGHINFIPLKKMSKKNEPLKAKSLKPTLSWWIPFGPINWFGEGMNYEILESMHHVVDQSDFIHFRVDKISKKFFFSKF